MTWDKEPWNTQIFNRTSRFQQLSETSSRGGDHCSFDSSSFEEDSSSALLVFPSKKLSNLESVNIIPDSRDLQFNTETNLLRPNTIDQPYPDLDSYVDTHFRLLYEDVMRPFKQGIRNMLNDSVGKRNAEVRLYSNVKFARDGLHFNERSVPDCPFAWRHYRIHFDELRQVNWEMSKRLIHGSLVCLWDGENEFITGITTFSSPKSLASGDVTLALATRDLSENYLEKTYVMIESVVFFEPYRVVLEALRSFTPQTFPLQDYVLGHVTTPRPPAYLENIKTFYLLRDAANEQEFAVTRPLEFESWPSAQQLGLDEKQHSSLISALTSQVSLVQGPPGTGKTFLALQIVKTLLANSSLWQSRFARNSKYQELGALVPRPPRLTNSEKSMKFLNRYIWERIGHRWHDPRAPILVVCLTNHALDQFLEGILKWTDKIVRVGGQSKSEAMKEYNLSEVKKRAVSQNIYTESNFPYYARNMHSLKESMKRKLGSMKNEMRLLKAEIPTLQNLKQENVIDSDVVCFFEAEQNGKSDVRYWHKKQKTKDDGAMKSWLGWENHNKLRRVARKMKLDLTRRAISKRKTKNAIDAGKFRKLIMETDREFSDDDVSDIVEDVTDDELDSECDSVSNVESGYQKSVASSVEEEVSEDAEDEGVVDDGILRDFQTAQLDQLDGIRQFLSNLPLIDSKINTGEMDNLPLKQRWQLFSNWRRCYRDTLNESVKKYEDDFVKDVVEYREKKGQSLAALCRSASVVGMTTTGAAKNRKLLEALRCKIVVVEEAAEVLESHVICSLTSDCQQLIMIGDHQQLRPSVNVHELEKEYHLDVSLFERLINVGMEPNVLGVQHRMRPEIARLITPAIYKDLKNAPSVHSRPSVSALLHDVFFYHHENQETKDESSYFNRYEVEMALQLAAYLCRQGVSQEHITILTTYAAQMRKLRDARRRQFEWLQNVHITVVDNYQGQENEIVILSLVRNNTRSSIGFLATANRICVALSRARCGFYMLGNMKLLAKCSSLWAQLNKILVDNNQIGVAFPVTCVRHKESVIMAARPYDFPSKRFCRQKCAFELKCGHRCPFKCHNEHVLHAVYCLQLVTVTLRCGHELIAQCKERSSGIHYCKELVETSEPCGHRRVVPCHLKEFAPCSELVPKLLPCGHEMPAPCSEPPENLECRADVIVQLKCSHAMVVSCHNRSRNFECKQMVSKQLPCGHAKRMECRTDPSSGDCGNIVEKDGACGHLVRYRCNGKALDNLEALPCEEVIKIALPCGHKQRGPCHRTPAPCHEITERKLDCGHEMRVVCSERSPRCEVKIAKKLECGHEKQLSCRTDVKSVECDAVANVERPACSHLVPVKCRLRNDSKYLNSIACSTLIRKLLPCGHAATLQCSKPVEDVTCTAVAPKMLPCGHYKELSCKDDPEHVACSEPVLVDLPCGHSTRMECSAKKKKNSYKCSLQVLKELPCGHSKEMACSRDPATETCNEPVRIAFDCGHATGGTCGTRNEARCRVTTAETLPCGHEQPVPCGSSPDEVECHAKAVATLPCGHDALVRCSEPVDDYECNVRVSKELLCGHYQEIPCHKDAFAELCRKCIAPEPEQNRMQNRMQTYVNEMPAMIRATLPCGHFKDIPSYRDPSNEICLQPLNVTLSCGHKQKVACSEADEKSPAKCDRLVKKRLTCGHATIAKCSDENVACSEMDEKRLGCGHTVMIKCFTPLSQRIQMLCGLKLTRHLPCGHKNEVACGSSDAEKPLNTFYCREKVRKIVSGCGHAVETECGKQVTRNECKSRCTKCLPCGHRCKLACFEDCAKMACDEMIDLPGSRRSCGHAVKGPCKLRYASKAERESWLRNYEQCNAICGEKMDCGHRCPGRCADCTVSYSHAVCQARCKRTLVCGHSCDAQCYVACPPCNKPCAYECVHGPCNKKCCEDCSPCEKPCAWRCPHRKCKHPCSEPCNREPCNEPCPKKLDCGHNCVGLCGEQCPPKCPNCLGSTVSINNNERYFYLECGHWVEVKQMDNWIFNREDNERESTRSKCFRLPCCPVCEKPVLKCFRYGDVIKDCYFDLPTIKFEYGKDVPVYDNSLIKSLRHFLADNDLASVHGSLKQLIREVEQVKQTKRINRDQLWDAVNRSNVMYEWLCLLSDVKRKYSAVLESKRYEFQVEDTEQYFQIGQQVAKKIAENRSCGSEFCHSLSDLYSRLDLLRQIQLVQTASVKHGIYLGRELRRAIDMSANWQEFDETDWEFLSNWLSAIAESSKLKLRSSVLKENEFFPRLSVSKGVWKKCLNENCGALFSSIRCDECPSC